MAVIIGTSGDDDLTAGPDGDTILGLEGNDIIRSGSNKAGEFYGGLGNDTYYISKADTIVENAGEGIDTVYTAIAHFTLAANIENLIYTSSGSTILNGNASDNMIVGGSSQDEIYGGAGNNYLDGGAGDTDRVRYDQAGASAVNVNLATGVVSNNGLGGVDTLIRIENVTGTAFTDTIVGDANANDLRGGTGGNDYIEGGGGNDRLTGGSSGNNHLDGGEGNDRLTTGGGTDYLDGGTGDDHMIGGSNNDTYVVDSLGDIVQEQSGEGTDTIQLNLAGAYTMAANVENLFANFAGAIVTGNILNNVLTGAAGSQSFRGLGGNNTIDGGAGVDTADYSTGTQTLAIDLSQSSASHNAFGGVDAISGIENVIGTQYNDTIVGNNEANRLEGGDGGDVLAGLDGDDVLIGGAGGLNNTFNEMAGGRGDDVYYQSASGDTLVEFVNEGIDIVHTTLASLTLRDNFEILIYDGAASFDGRGNDIDNVLQGGTQSDTLSGRGGNDSLYGGTGAANTLVGGTGDDWYYISVTGDSILELAGEGDDRVLASVSYTLSAGQSIETLNAADPAATTAINLTGNALAQLISGNAGANVLTGGGGSDYLVGYGGNDILVGNADASSTLQGGTGDDWYYISRTGDSLVEFASEGNDRILTGVSYTLSAGQEIETLAAVDAAGTAAIDLTGNGFGQIVQGTNGANTLSGDGGADDLAGFGGADILLGGDGDDLLNGGAGNDVLNGGAGADLLVFADALGAGNIDTVQNFVSGQDRLLVENAVFTGLAAGTLSAGAFVTGTAAQDADDRFIYNSTTGALLFDADGNGAGAAVQFATLAPASALTASDFVVI